MNQILLTFLLFPLIPLKALVIELLEEIKTSPKQGTFKAKIIDSNENKQVLGTYKISLQNKLTLKITHIATLNTYQPLDEKPSLQTILSPNRSIIPKNTQIVFSSKEFKEQHSNSLKSPLKTPIQKQQNKTPLSQQSSQNFSYLDFPNKLRSKTSKNSFLQPLTTPNKQTLANEVKTQINDTKPPLKTSQNNSKIKKEENNLIIMPTEETLLNNNSIDENTEEKAIKDPNIKEFACGKWVYEDEHLQASRPSILKRFDEEKQTYTDITPCDYNTTEGKTGKIITPYTKISLQKAEPLEEPQIFEAKNNFSVFQAKSSIERCKGARMRKDGTIRQCYLIEEPLKQAWESQYEITTQLIKAVYERPKQDDQVEPTFYETSELAYTSTRKSEITHNELHLSDKFMEFVEVYEGHYLNDIVKESSEYKEWVKKHVRLKEGVCITLEIEEQQRAKSTPLSIENSRLVCVKRGNYLFNEV
ncbi:competence protein [Helicobacter cetorum]|uniref:competence protein n=1 Tax=Helicobacter cetorum TaxID=138563 RepID=UPI000CF1A662|nr:competence protein [Helicobacter cetorum]